jgi:metallophosphoesterase (TIGR00282 family)
VGKPGREAVRILLPQLKERFKLDLVVANCENSAGGLGLTPKTVNELFSYGIDILTTGDHIWDRKEVLEIIEHPYLLRPLNLSINSPGKGFCLFEKEDVTVCVVNLLGRVFMEPVDCPFQKIKDLLEIIKKKTNIIIVDFHAEATSEKKAMGYFLDGEVCCVLGTHTHVQTADEQILEKGCGYITDVGMTGSFDSIIGQEKERIITRFLTGMPVRFQVAERDIRLEAVVLDIDPKTGKTNSIQRIRKNVLRED